MMLLFLPALAYLIYLSASGESSLGRVSVLQHILLLLTGIVTAVPLFLFAMGARRVTLTTLGILQYLAPTGQYSLFIHPPKTPWNGR